MQAGVHEYMRAISGGNSTESITKACLCYQPSGAIKKALGAQELLHSKDLFCFTF
jgi:hypothetical protein